MDKKTEALKLAEDALKRVRTQDMELVQLSMIALAAIRKALAEQPAPMIRGDIRDGLVDDEPAHQHIEHCLWARNGNQPCPHVQPAQQQEPVVFYRCNGCGHAYEQVHPTSCDCMEAGGFDRVEYYTYPPAQRKPLTDEELYKVFPAIATYTEANKTLYRSIARAIEAKLREKNT